MMTNKSTQPVPTARDAMRHSLPTFGMIKLRTLVYYLKARKLALYIAWRVVRFMHESLCADGSSVSQREA